MWVQQYQAKQILKQKLLLEVKVHYILTECSICQTGLTTPNLYASNNIASKYLSKNITKTIRRVEWGEIEKEQREQKEATIMSYPDRSPILQKGIDLFVCLPVCLSTYPFVYDKRIGYRDSRGSVLSPSFAPQCLYDFEWSGNSACQFPVSSASKMSTK